MRNQEIRTILLKELNIEDLPEEAQDEIISKIGDTVLASVTSKIFERLSQGDRKKFDAISASGNDGLINEFLEMTVPDMHNLMEEEIKKTIRLHREKEREAAE